MAKRNDTPTVRWGFLDTAISRISPRIARRRYSERVAIANMRRLYEAASKGRATEGWRAPGTSADAEIDAAGSILRDRMRDLVRNNPMAAQAVQVLVNNIVGYGIRPRARTGTPALDKRIDQLFERWSTSCDAHGHTNFEGLTALGVREMIEGGDCFAIRRRLRWRRGDPLPLRIELREADHLDDAKFDNRADRGRIKGGIEYDAQGRRVGYWMFPDHPGDRDPIFSRTLESQRVPADRVAHLFERQRVQNRGVPWGTPAMRAIREVDSWQEAELVRKRTEACVVGIVFGDNEDDMGIAPSVVDGDGNMVEQFQPGMIAYARGGKDVKFNQPSTTAGVYEWHRVQLHIIAAGFRVPYALMTGDLSQNNFSSSRVGLNEFRRMVEMIQWEVVIPMFCEPIWRWFIEAGKDVGEIPEDAVVRAEWAPPRFESVNPLQDAQADRLEVRAGFSSLAQQIARRGYDPEAMIEEIAETNAKLDEHGLVLDSDPRRVTQAGMIQAEDGRSDPPEGTGGRNEE